MTPYVGRLAPSPTGLLHVGHARSFLLAWWSARSRGGRVVLRIEDIDAGRARPEWAEASLRDLEWLGLDWDGAPLRQLEDTSQGVHDDKDDPIRNLGGLGLTTVNRVGHRDGEKRCSESA